MSSLTANLGLDVIDRVIEVAEAGGRLSLDLNRLKIIRDQETLATVPLGEIAALVLAHPRITLTHPVLDGIAKAGGIVAICDDRRMPSGMLLPLQAFGLPAQRMGGQRRLTEPRRKRIWQHVVRSKILAQARLLERLDGSSGNLRSVAERVKSGDSGNAEGEAARQYWRALFGPAFRRDRDGVAPNPALNYGYAILRAIVTRSICGAGLHPCMGVQHHHRSNPFCLADDVMEPFRPVVDAAVVERFGRDPHQMPVEAGRLDRDTRQSLIAAVLDRYDVEGESRTLPDLVRRGVNATVNAMSEGTRDYTIPAP